MANYIILNKNSSPPEKNNGYENLLTLSPLIGSSAVVNTYLCPITFTHGLYEPLKYLRFTKDFTLPDWVLDFRIFFLGCLNPATPSLLIKTIVPGADFCIVLPVPVPVIPPTIIAPWDSWFIPAGVGIVPSLQPIVAGTLNTFAIDSLPGFTYFGLVSLTTKMGSTTEKINAETGKKEEGIESLSFYLECGTPPAPAQKLLKVTIPVSLISTSRFQLKSVNGPNPLIATSNKTKELTYETGKNMYALTLDVDKKFDETQNEQTKDVKIDNEKVKTNDSKISKVIHVKGEVKQYTNFTYSAINEIDLPYSKEDVVVDKSNKDIFKNMVPKIQITKSDNSVTYSNYTVDLVNNLTPNSSKLKINWSNTVNSVNPSTGDSLKLTYYANTKYTDTFSFDKDTSTVNLNTITFEPQTNFEVLYEYNYNNDKLIKG